MRAILLDPHGDDAVLFATFTCLREHAHIVVTNPTVPHDEIVAAFHVLGDCTFEIINKGPVSKRLGAEMYVGVEVVYAPEYHDQGHADHNVIALLARGIWGERVVPYLTYAPRGSRQRDGVEILPDDSRMIALKLRALSCFESQIEQTSTRPWFYELLDMREWVSA